MANTNAAAPAKATRKTSQIKQTPVKGKQTRQRARGKARHEAPDPHIHEPKRGAMKVQAFRMGIYGHKRRRDGDVFVLLNAKDFNPSWMLEVADATPTKITTPSEHLKQEHDRILGAKYGATPGTQGGQPGDSDDVEG